MNVFDACCRNQWDLAEKLFNENPIESVRFRDRQNWSILHEVCNRNAPFAFVYKLLTHRSDVNSLNLSRRTPLHYAVQSSTSIDLIVLLLGFGANPNLGDNKGNTALHWAVIENASVECFRFLIAARGDLLRKNHRGMNSLHLAIELQTSLALISVLVKFSPQSLNAVDEQRQCPLFLSLLVSSPRSIVKLLLENGAQISTKQLRVAQYHGDSVLCDQIERSKLLILLVGFRRDPCGWWRIMPMELMPLLSQFLFK